MGNFYAVMSLFVLVFRQKVVILHSEINKKQSNGEIDYTIYQNAWRG